MASKIKHRQYNKNQRLFTLSITAIICLYEYQGQGNVVGTASQNFNSITNGLYFITVESSETLSPGLINLGFFTNYAKNSFSYLTGQTSNGVPLQDNLVSSDLNFGLGLKHNWDLGVSLPNFLYYQDNTPSNRTISLGHTGFTEIRPNSKYRIFGNRQGGLAFVTSMNINLLSNDPYAGSGGGPTFNFLLAADAAFARQFALGLNVGYRLRNPGSQVPGFPVQPSGNQYVGSLAASYLFPKTVIKFIAEVYGSMPTQYNNANTDNSLTALEWITGIKADVTRSLALILGGGSRLTSGNASPDYRVFAGINCAFGPLWETGGQKILRVAPPPVSYLEKTVDPEKDPVDPFAVDPKSDKPIEVFIPSDVLFVFNSDSRVESLDITKDAIYQFATKVKKLAKFTKIIISGHTDSIGREDYNLELSRRRAENVKKYLVTKHQMDPRKIVTVGFGDSMPIGNNGNYQGRRLNRRVEFKIYLK